MKNYEIIAKSTKEKNKIQGNISNLKLEDRLIAYHPHQPNSCALEVYYKVANGNRLSKGGWQGNALLVYIVNENNPSIHIYDAGWVAFSPENKKQFGTFTIGNTLIRILKYNPLKQ